MPAVLTIQDNNKSIDVQVNHPIHIELAGNPTTGYRWTRAGFEKQQALSDDQFEVISEYKAAPAPAGMCGSGGSFHISVKPKHAGKHTIDLVYARPFEGPKPENQRFTLHMNVQ